MCVAPSNGFVSSCAAGMLAAGLGLVAAPGAGGADATFVRAINLNGPALTIDGREWEAERGAEGFKVTGKRFANQKVLLRPPTDADRTEMIRSSVWDGTVSVEFSGLEPGAYQVFLYVWEDNQTEQFDLLVGDKVVQAGFYSGDAGMWKRLGPWAAPVTEGTLRVGAKGASHGAANLSGIELWAGEGPVPEWKPAPFAGMPTAGQLEFFEARIRPVLVEQCYECHSAGAKKLRGGLLLDSSAGVRKGGESGPVVTPGLPDASLLIQALRHASEDLAMPPKLKLPPHVVADFEEWVRMGVPDPRDTDTLAAVRAREAIDWEQARQWWAFRPLTGPVVPAVEGEGWVLNDIDRFILAKQEAAGLKPSADAGKRALLRRATYDLTGLPPTPGEIDDFLGDDTEHAFAAVVERLLASPRYGERWGRHWLDVVRYADTAGDNSDYPIPQMHRYRDWVIGAFNRDLPYDQFVREQIAGDLLGGGSDEERYERIVATGYIASARRFGSRVDDYPQHLTIEDTIDNLGRSFLGLTVNCARCHDHKFDPIPTGDYYALYGIFQSTRYPWPGIELDKKQRDLVPLVPVGKLAEVEPARKAWEKEQTRLEKEVGRLKDFLKNTSEAEKPGVRAQIERAEAAVAGHQQEPLPFEFAYAVAESGRVFDAAVQQKGDPAKPGPVVPRRFLTVLGGAELPPGAKSSGRAQLAGWITAGDNPLTARVMVNRIWQHHFGRGIVPTPNDFGKQGKPPTHPGLLDYLAVRFREGGWSVKAMHRLIMLSRTYRQAAVRDGEAIAHDPSNELLAGFSRRRLDAESIRDSLLALGGNLDLSPAGGHPFPPPARWDFTQHKPFKEVYETSRRSVFLMTQRIQRHPYLAIFDGADPSASTPARPTSTTPLQALYLLNDSFVHEQSRRVAERLTAQTNDEAGRIRNAYELLLARPPVPEEVRSAREFLVGARARLLEEGVGEDRVDSEIWHAFVRVLFRLNEFIYLD